MKKLTAMILAAALILAAAGCNRQTVTYNPVKPYWMNKEAYSNIVDPNINETCIYSVKHIQDETPNTAVKAEYDAENCVYIAALTAEKYPEDGDYCYLFTETYDISGKYIVGETEYPFRDVSENKVYFTWDSGFRFKYSERTDESTLPVNALGTADERGNTVVKTKAKETVTYTDTDAITTFEALENAEYFGSATGSGTTFKKVFNKNYIDYNLLTFALRSFDFAKELNYSFYTVDVITGTKHSMKYTGKGTVSESIKNLLTNGIVQVGVKVRDDDGAFTDEYGKFDTVLSAETFSFSISLSETYSGSPLIVNYFSDTDTFRHYMYKMATNLPFNLGSLEYRLIEIKNM